MSNINVSSQASQNIDTSNNSANLHGNVATSATQNIKNTSSSNVKPEDVSTTNTGTSSVSAPVLSQPKISASSAMILLMALQAEANNQSLDTGLTQTEMHQADMAEQNETRMNDSLSYFETMNQQENVNGSMAIANVVISALMVVASIMGVATGGVAAVAGAIGCLGAIAALANSIVSLPSVQENMDPKVAQGVSIALMITSIICTVVSCAAGFGAIKCAAKLGTQAATVGLRVGTQTVSNIVQTSTALLDVTSASVNIATSSVNMKAAKVQEDASELSAEKEELQAKIDASYGSLDVIMQSYASMVQSTAEMIQKTCEGSKSAASSLPA